MRPPLRRRRSDAPERTGTTTLFAALNVLDGSVSGRNMARHRHQEFIRSLVDRQAAINRFINEHNQEPMPFDWKANPDDIIAAVKRGFQTLESIHYSVFRPDGIRPDALSICFHAIFESPNKLIWLEIALGSVCREGRLAKQLPLRLYRPTRQSPALVGRNHAPIGQFVDLVGDVEESGPVGDRDDGRLAA